ncbi:MAG: phosphoribosylaminoimidazolesuccinocarboxamide synthase, partial [Acidimicrobiia bacterium]
MISLPHLYSGKVRDLYDAGDDRILMVASDRISVFDVVLPDLIPDKGRVLTALSTFWFDFTADLLPNHVISVDPADFPAGARPDADGRATLVRRTDPVTMECIARGYLFGSAWKEYRKQGTVQGRPMPAGMQEAEPLPEPLFTPTTKADAGHDLPMSDAEAIDLVGAETFARLESVALAIYERG